MDKAPMIIIHAPKVFDGRFEDCDQLRHGKLTNETIYFDMSACTEITPKGLGALVILNTNYKKRHQLILGCCSNKIMEILYM